MLDLENILNIFGSSGISFAPELGFLTAIVILTLIGIIGAAFAFSGLMVRGIGRKFGLDTDWMAFVPFARTIYRLQMLKEPWWKLFFLEHSWLYFIIIRWFFNLFENSTMTTFGNVLAILYVLWMIAYNIYYRINYYKAFNLKPELALSIVPSWGFLLIVYIAMYSTPNPMTFAILGTLAVTSMVLVIACCLSLTRVIDCIIAFTGLIQYGGRKAASGSGSSMSQSKSPAASSSSRREIKISGLSGMYAGQDIPIATDDDLVIGRDAEMANVVIDQNADKVSRKHCLIRFDSSRNVYMVTDFSSNGTFIDGGSRMVTKVPTPMQRGAVIALGNRENRFRLN